MRNIKQMLRAQELVIGLSIWHTCSPWIAKVYSDAGADFVFVDTEHIFFNGADLANLISSCLHLGLPVVAKCPYMDRGAIANLQDAGVMGIQLPMTESAEQMAQIVSWVKFPPLGVRAAGPGIGNSNYETTNCKTWMEQTNEDSTVIAHIESKDGIEHVEEILRVPNVDIAYVGMLDLSISLGHPECYDHPDIVKAVERLIDVANTQNKVVGMSANSYEMAEPWIRRGVRFFEMTSEAQFVAKGASNLLKRMTNNKNK